MSDILDLKFRDSNTEDILKALDVLKVQYSLDFEYDPESSRNELWSLYKEQRDLVVKSEPLETEADPTQDGKTEDNVVVPDPVTVEEAELVSTPADTVPTQVIDSRTDDQPPSPVDHTALKDMLKDAYTVLDYFGNLAGIPSLRVFCETAEFSSVHKPTLDRVVDLLQRRRRSWHYSDANNGAEIYAAELVQAYYELSWTEVEELYSEMKRCLQLKADRLISTQKRVLVEAALPWLSILYKD